jgi:hypothetical protein
VQIWASAIRRVTWNKDNRDTRLQRKQSQEQQHRNAALPPRQPAENEEVMWRSAAHHAPVATTMHTVEASAAVAPSPSRALYEGQDQMIQQDAWHRWHVDVWMGLEVGVESELWGAIEFVPGEWERMYTGLWADHG